MRSPSPVSDGRVTDSAITSASPLHEVIAHEPLQQSAAGLRIALLSGNYNCVRDGSNRALNRLTDFLLKRGAAVRVYSPTTATPAFKPIGDLVSVPSLPIPKRPEYRLASPLTRAVRADIKSFRPTHFHLSAPDFLGMSAMAHAKRLGVPVVVSHHTEFETYLEYYRLSALAGWMRRRIRRFYAQADTVLAPTLSIAERFLDWLPAHRVAIWGRGVDQTVFTPDARDLSWRRELGYRDSDTIVLFLGRVVLEKGLEIFASVIDELRLRGHAIVPLVIGAGPELEWFRDRLGDAQVTGHLEDAALGRAVASADILINPSDTEAFGNVNLEAMACGLAIVSADVESARSLLSSGTNGVLVSARDVGAYADAVERLISSETERRRLGRAAIEASRRYSWTEVLTNVLLAYRSTDRR